MNSWIRKAINKDKATPLLEAIPRSPFQAHDTFEEMLSLLTSREIMVTWLRLSAEIFALQEELLDRRVVVATVKRLYD